MSQRFLSRRFVELALFAPAAVIALWLAANALPNHVTHFRVGLLLYVGWRISVIELDRIVDRYCDKGRFRQKSAIACLAEGTGRSTTLCVVCQFSSAVASDVLSFRQEKCVTAS